MRCKAFIAAMACFIALVACTSERQESAAARVIDIDNAPCFLIHTEASTENDGIKIQQIQVVDSKGKKKWQVSFDKGAALKKHQCFLYGRTVPDMLVEETPTPLMTDEVYTVALIAPTDHHPEIAFAYVANFCMLNNNGKNTVVMLNEMPMNALPSCPHTNAN